MQQPFMAFENETDGFTVGNLNIKNGTEMITIEGSLHISKDKQGLEAALKRDRNLPDSIRD
jgi:hypothetical protein